MWFCVVDTFWLVSRVIFAASYERDVITEWNADKTAPKCGWGGGFLFFWVFLNVAMKESMARGTWKSPEQEEEVVA